VLTVRIRFSFKAFDDSKRVLDIIRIDIGDVIDPAEVLLDPPLGASAKAEAVLWEEVGEGLELLVDGGQAIFLQDNHMLPVICPAAGERGTARIQTIKDQANWQTWEPPLETLGETIEGLELAVLYGGVLTRVLDELGHKRKDEAAGGRQLSLQDRVIVCRPTIARARQAVGAVSLGKAEHAGAVDDDEEVPVQQTMAVEDLLADQGLNQAGDRLLELVGVQSSKCGVESVSVWARWHAKEGLELEC
jgi:hypothetical protein